MASTRRPEDQVPGHLAEMCGHACTGRQVAEAIHRQLATHDSGPLLVALDGGSGAGKSTLAGRLATALGAGVVHSDDFFDATRSDADWDHDSPAERATLAIDGKRLRRAALEPLLRGRAASWHPFDLTSTTGLAAAR